jgi:hypothetical protein
VDRCENYEWGGIDMKKIMKRIFLGLLGLIVVIIMGLFINNRIMGAKYSKVSTNSAILSDAEIEAVNHVYTFLNDKGEEIFPGFNGKDIDLIIYNDSYEFLLSNNENDKQWEPIGKNDELNKNIYRINANNPQAFAVYVNDRWVGSMSTINSFNKGFAKNTGYLFPPQIVMLDEQHYTGVVIHEMLHAFQGKNNDLRVRNAKSLDGISSNYYDDNKFNKLIIEEGYYLEHAIKATNKETIIEYAKGFIDTRQNRRIECNMSKIEIENETDFEWLEGLARYAEYKSSTDSKSLVRKNMDKIEQKVKSKQDDRYYTFGMAEALVLDKLQKDWKDEMFDKNFSLEKKIEQLVK